MDLPAAIAPVITMIMTVDSDRDGFRMSRPSIYQYAGGAPAFPALAADFHARCLADPELEHPFSHTSNPEHVRCAGGLLGRGVRRAAGLLRRHGGHTGDAGRARRPGHASDLGRRVRALLTVAAVDGAHLPDDPELRAALRSYMEWATAEVMSYNPPGRGAAGSAHAALGLGRVTQ